MITIVLGDSSSDSNDDGDDGRSRTRSVVIITTMMVIMTKITVSKIIIVGGGGVASLPSDHLIRVNEIHGIQQFSKSVPAWLFPRATSRHIRSGYSAISAYMYAKVDRPCKQEHTIPSTRNTPTE